MLQHYLSYFSGSVRRVVPLALSPAKRHAAHCTPGRHPSCPSIFTTTAVCRKLSSLEEGHRHVDPDSDGKKPQRPSLLERLKLGWRKYGVLGVTTYCILYVATLSQIYLALENDVFNCGSIGMDPASVVQKMSHTLENITGIDDISIAVQEHPQIGTFFLAYVVNQFTEPFRVAAMVYLLPRIASYMGKTP